MIYNLGVQRRKIKKTTLIRQKNKKDYVNKTQVNRLIFYCKSDIPSVSLEKKMGLGVGGDVL